jgi:hypothetical protein
MKTLIHLKKHQTGLFHPHPEHALFSLVASFVLALLAVLILVTSAR